MAKRKASRNEFTMGFGETLDLKAARASKRRRKLQDKKRRKERDQ